MAPVAALLALERFLPPYRYEQEIVIEWVRRWLARTDDPQAHRLLSVYTTSAVRTRASVVPIERVFAPRDFEAQNELYIEHARGMATDMARRALETAALAPSEIDAVVSVSCTGYMIPAVDAHVADALRMGPRLVRLPITESGCAGGIVALARACDFLAAHPDKAALVLAVELSSLTFQPWDYSPANVISTAIFGDGGAALVLVGARHPRAAGTSLARFVDFESQFFPGTSHLMGFRLRNSGLQIILDRELAPFVRREVAPAVERFCAPRGLTRASVGRWILHPGGRRIIDVMASALELGPPDLAATETVMAEHGNMSSVTVLFVLDEILREHPPAAGERGIMGAFGPGFGAEFALLEFR
jgi:alkylresorcinol/alkylpyrone synthase